MLALQPKSKLIFYFELSIEPGFAFGILLGANEDDRIQPQYIISNHLLNILTFMIHQNNL